MKLSKLIIIFLCIILVGCTDKNSFSSLEFEKALDKSNIKYSIKELDKDGKDHRLFSAPPKIYVIKKESIILFEYRTEKGMEKEAGYISEDGGYIKNSFVDYISKPHYFKKGRVFVSYFGENEGILNFLEEVFGKQFAGSLDEGVKP
jgi:hypothetical protein